MLTKLDVVMLSIVSVAIVVASQIGEYENETTQVTTVKDQSVLSTAVKPVKKERVTEKLQPAAQGEVSASELPDFAAINDVREKKRTFFDYMLPIIEARNSELKSMRDRIKRLRHQGKLTNDEIAWLQDVADRYALETTEYTSSDFFDRLLKRVDIIPPSLALAQAANESAWGTSRFALQGNNLFGQWCFSKGCGLVPNARPAGATYEVRKFDNIAESVRAYMHNLNTHHQYESLRSLRANKRKSNDAVTGPVLAHGLYAYSIRGLEYVDELIAMIRINHLLPLDHPEKPVDK